MNEQEGLVYVFMGDGKGKTSAALGVATRMLLLDKKVEWISWFKTVKWQISESRLPLFFKDNLKMHWSGEGFFIKNGAEETRGDRVVKVAKTKSASVFDTASPEEHKRAARQGLELARHALEKTKPPELLVLDEILRAVSEELLTEEEVLDLILKRGAAHLVLTGHSCPPKLRECSDLVTEMKKIKHPYDEGTLAVRGLDF